MMLTMPCFARSGLDALQQDLSRAEAQLKEAEDKLHDMEAKSEQVAKQVRLAMAAALRRLD